MAVSVRQQKLTWELVQLFKWHCNTQQCCELLTATQAFEEGFTKAMYVTKSKQVMFSVSMQDYDKFPSNSIVNCCTDVIFSVQKFQQPYSCTNV